jgi:hypothetical protein
MAKSSRVQAAALRAHKAIAEIAVRVMIAVAVVRAMIAVAVAIVMIVVRAMIAVAVAIAMIVRAQTIVRGRMIEVAAMLRQMLSA